MFIFQICHWSIQDNTYKWFQLRILYADVFRCRNKIENIIHMLLLCLKVKELWNLVLEYIKGKGTGTLIITPLNIILDYTLAEVNHQPINTIIFVAKKVYI